MIQKQIGEATQPACALCLQSRLISFEQYAKSESDRQKALFIKSCRGGTNMQYKYLKYDVSDGILMLTLNRPENMNAVNPLFCRELISAFEQADQDDSARAVIVTGAGRAFWHLGHLGSNLYS